MKEKKTKGNNQKPLTKKEAEPKKKYTRTESICLALKKRKSGTARDYAAMADDIYVSGGGATGKEASLWLVRTLFEAFVLIGYLNKEGDNYKVS